uniref:V2 n=1 Tax=Bhendi yellow vein mosaic virus TaxID=120168 RepID=J7JH73_9GEMI|nr:V2 [Bhendi yellow vein mosaic virus]
MQTQSLDNAPLAISTCALSLNSKHVGSTIKRVPGYGSRVSLYAICKIFATFVAGLFSRYAWVRVNTGFNLYFTIP